MKITASVLTFGCVEPSASSTILYNSEQSMILSKNTFKYFLVFLDLIASMLVITMITDR